MTITELIKSTIDSSKDRLKTPIVGSYICSFIIFNWRPIFVLLFSDENIESRIASVNRYFTPWYWNVISIIVPIAISLGYTFGIPLLMVWVEQKLETTKEKRITRIYKAKEFVIKKKIVLAVTERDLKDLESGNKQKEDLLQQIKSLEESKNQIEQSRIQTESADRNTITQLNDKLKEANQNFESLYKSIPPYLDVQSLLNKNVSSIDEEKLKNYNIELNAMSEGNLADWQLDQLFSLWYLNKSKDGTVNVGYIDDMFLENLKDLKVISLDYSGNYKFTENGMTYVEYVKTKNRDDYKRFKAIHNI
jgi:hypothetical protein